MKSIKPKYIIILLFLFFSGLILWHFLALLSFENYTEFSGNSEKVSLYPDSPIIQKFVAGKNNLNQIKVAIDNFSPGWKDKIILKVADEKCDEILAQSEINKFTWNTVGFEKMSFPPIADSQGKTFCLRFNFLSSEKPKELPAIKAYPQEGSSYINSGESLEEQKNWSLAIKPGYGEGSAWKNFGGLMTRMSQYKPDYFKGWALEVIFIAALILVILIGYIVIII